MTEEFIDFVKEIYPNIEPFTAEKAKSAIRQFKLFGRDIPYFRSTPFDFLTQGDIIEPLSFIRFDRTTGNTKILKNAKAMLISNTCDAENDDDILFAAFFEINKVRVDKKTALSNTYSRLFSFPHSDLSEFMVDFSVINSYPRSYIQKRIDENKIKKLKSFTQTGYYMFLCKLSVYLMRREDSEVYNSRDIFSS